MASRAAKIAAVAREIFGTLPNRNVRTGLQFLKKPLTGAYEARYYMEPIEPYARKVRATLCVCDNVLFRTMRATNMHVLGVHVQRKLYLPPES